MPEAMQMATHLESKQNSNPTIANEVEEQHMSSQIVIAAARGPVKATTEADAYASLEESSNDLIS